MTYARVPRPPRTQIVREGLLDRIDQGPAITVLTGPPGFGKTTLAAQWAQACDRRSWPVVWITVDASTDPATFWRMAAVSFASALDAGDLGESAPAPATVAAMLASHTGEVAWVVDRLRHDLPAQLLDDVLTLSAHSSNLHLLLCSVGPPAPILSLRLRLNVEILTAEQLAFSPDETGRLLDALGVPLPDDLTRQLHAEVEGWPLLVAATAGLLPPLQVSIADVRSAARRAADHLAEHQLASLDPRLAGPLLRSAIPDRLTPTVVGALTDVDDALAYLEGLTSAGLLSKSSPEGDVTFTFPNAVRDALRDWFRRESPDEYRKLLADLTTHYLNRGDDHAIEALRTALRSEDIPLITQVVERRWLAILRADRTILATALDTMSPETIASSRALTSAQTLALGIRPAAADRPDLPHDPRHLAVLGRRSGAGELLLHAMATGIAIRRQGNIDEAVGLFGRLAIVADAARKQRDPETLPELPTVYVQSGFTYVLAGRLSSAIELLRHAYDLRQHHRPGYAGNDAAGKLALASALKGDLRSATLWLARADECERESSRYDGWLLPYVRSTRHVARAICHLEEGNLDDATAELECRADLPGDEASLVALSVQALHAQLAGVARHLLDEWPVLRHAQTVDVSESEAAAGVLTASYADLHMAAGRGTRAGALLRSCDSDVEEIQVSAARWALLTGQLDEALYRAGRLLWDGTTRWRTRLHLQLIAAAVHEREGRWSEADALLTQAVSLASRNGMHTPFATADRALLERRAGAVEGLGAILSGLDRRGFVPVFPGRLDVIVLSEREQAVLTALESGLPIDRIARGLYVSVNTVKSQMRSLYAKLGTHSRVDTLVKAREHGLLKPSGRPPEYAGSAPRPA